MRRFGRVGGGGQVCGCLKDWTGGLRCADGEIHVQFTGGRNDFFRIKASIRIHHDLVKGLFRFGLVCDHQTVRAVAVRRAPRPQIGHLNVQFDRTEALSIRTVYAPDAGDRSICVQLFGEHGRMQNAGLVGQMKIAVLQQWPLLLSVELKVAVFVFVILHAQRSIVQNEAGLMVGQVGMNEPLVSGRLGGRLVAAVCVIIARNLDR